MSYALNRPLFGFVSLGINFAHGGLLAIGILVSVFFVHRFAEAGLSRGILPEIPALTLSVNQDTAEAEARAPIANLDEKAQAQIAEYLAKRYRVADRAVLGIVSKVSEVAHRDSFDPLLLLALICVESSFNPYAESNAGAQGLMQVIPKWHPEKMAAHGEDASLLDVTTNISVGSMVLREYVDRYGSIVAGLQKYNGALGDPATPYANKVLGTKRRLVEVLAQSRAA